MANKSQLPKKGGKPRTGPRGSKSSRQASLVLIGIAAAVLVILAGIIWLSSSNAGRKYTATGRSDEGTSWGPADAPAR